MSDAPNQDRPTNTQTARWLKYGLNVAVALVAAAALVVLLNVIAYHNYYRIDLTATRRYSLSAQTEKVLDQLKGQHQIITLFRGSSEHLQQVRDTIDEYARYSNDVTVRHLNPALDVAQSEAFHQNLRQRFDAELAPTVKAVTEARQSLALVADRFAVLAPTLHEAAEHPELAAGSLKDFVRQVADYFDRNAADLKTNEQTLAEAMDQALPAYSEAQAQLTQLLRELDEKLISPVITRFQQTLSQQNVPAAVKNELLSAARQLEQARATMRPALEALSLIQPVEQYDQTRTALLSREAVVVLGPKQVRVIPAAEMFRQVDPEVVEQAGQPQLSFLGEERLTGTLVSMSLEQPPLVVFVLAGPGAAVGPRGQYEYVAQRLRNANFQVEQWNPAGQTTTFGQTTPPSPPPQPAAGQKAIWIVLPQPPPDPMNPASLGGGAKQQIATHLQSRLRQGDAALVLLAPDPAASFGEADAVVEFLADWGITPQTDRIILHETQVSDRKTRASTQIQITDWPDALPITQAMGGMPAVFLQTSPLTLDTGEASGLKHYPLVEIRGDRYWAEDEMTSLQAVQESTFDPEASAEVFTVGAAAEREGQRLIVVTDPVWASDHVASIGRHPLFGAQPGFAAQFGPLFPGNGELFVNSVYWLAGLDELIAASPHAHRISRIEAMTDARLNAYRWLLLAGLPLAVAASGVGVWFVRRRS